MKKSVKNRSSADSYGAGDAAALLGISIPTLKRMVKDGTLDGFRTPGGHLRISAESIEAAKNNPEPRPRTRDASPVLQNRRERLEELTLEAQELRAQRELGKLRREEREEAEQREAEAHAREEEAEQRRAEIVIERERLEREKAEDRRRRQREQAEEQARVEDEQELTAFRERWYSVAGQAVATMPRLNWLTATQRKEVTEALEAEIDRRQPSDQARMNEIISRTLAAAIEPLQAERDAQERRQRLTDEALRSLPYSATDADKVKATTAIREALRPFDRSADLCEMRVAVGEAVLPVRQIIQKRELDDRLLQGAVWKLPFGRSDEDVARVRRECAEILADLPADVSEAEAKGALEPTIREACREIDERKSKADRQTRKANLIQQGIAEVVTYMAELLRKGELTREEYYDPELTEHWRTLVRRGLESDLTGDESTTEARELVRELIGGEIA
jgi:excisionase family DNA binding protein